MHPVCSGQLATDPIAEHADISRRHYFNWLKDLNEDGLPGLLRREHGGG